MTTLSADFPEPTDAELVGRVRGGEADAFGPLVRRHITAVRTFVAMKRTKLLTRLSCSHFEILMR
jgi:hypothetical protein